MSVNRLNVLGELIDRHIIHVVLVQRRSLIVRIIDACNFVVPSLQTHKVILRPNVPPTIIDGVHQLPSVISMLAASHFNDVAGRIVIAWTLQRKCAEERHQLFGASLVDALSVRQCVELIEHLEQTGRRLMDGADNCSASASQELQQIDALEASGTVQTGSRFVEEHNRRIVDQLQRNGQSLLLASGQVASQRATMLLQSECVKDFLDLRVKFIVRNIFKVAISLYTNI